MLKPAQRAGYLASMLTHCFVAELANLRNVFSKILELEAIFNKDGCNPVNFSHWPFTNVV